MAVGRRQADEREALDGVHPHRRPDRLEQPWDEVDPYVEVLQGADQLELEVVAVVRERDDHPLHVVRAHDLGDLLGRPEDGHVVEILAHRPG